MSVDISDINLTPEMAWCLGLIYGDGHVANVGHQVTIVTSDKDVAEKFAKIHGRPRVIDADKYYRVTWTCARLYRELESYVLCPNKSANSNSEASSESPTAFCSWPD